MIETLRHRWRQARQAASARARTARAVSATGMLEQLSPSGIATFLRQFRDARGPHTALLWHACNRPEQVAIQDGQRRLSWTGLNREVNQFAHALARRGVGDGDRVAIMLRNCVEHLVVAHALWRLGATAVELGYRLKAEQIAAMLEATRTAAIVCHRDYASLVDQARHARGVPQADHMFVVGAPPGWRGPGMPYIEALVGKTSAAPPNNRYANAGAIISYTSGTTGQPKGVLRHIGDGPVVSALDFMKRVGMSAGDRHLVVAPLYHSGAMAFAQLLSAIGATTVITEHFDGERVLETIEKERISGVFVVPRMLERLVHAGAAGRPHRDTSSLRWVVSGAGPLAPATARRFQEKFGYMLWNFYGATELGLVSVAGPYDHETRPGTVGTALRGNRIRICDESGAERPRGDVGEIWVAGDLVVHGYEDGPAAGLRAERGDYVSVGDAGWLDADGHLYVVGRWSELALAGPQHLFPRALENHIYSHPAVIDCAVVTTANSAGGPSFKAYVVARPGRRLLADEVRAFCQTGPLVGDTACDVHIVPNLPRDPMGKLNASAVAPGHP